MRLAIPTVGLEHIEDLDCLQTPSTGRIRGDGSKKHKQQSPPFEGLCDCCELVGRFLHYVA